jgi:hypothetical protein
VFPGLGPRMTFPSRMPSPSGVASCGYGAESLRVPCPCGFVDASRLTRLRGRGCRSRAARLATPERRRDRHGPARARPSRWARPDPLEHISKLGNTSRPGNPHPDFGHQGPEVRSRGLSSICRNFGDAVQQTFLGGLLGQLCLPREWGMMPGEFHCVSVP